MLRLCQHSLFTYDDNNNCTWGHKICLLCPTWWNSCSSHTALPASYRTAARSPSCCCGLGPVHLLLAQPEHKHFLIYRRLIVKLHICGHQKSPMPRQFWPLKPPRKHVSPRFYSPLPQSVQFILRQLVLHFYNTSTSTCRFPFATRFLSGWGIPPLRYGCHGEAAASASFECSFFLIYASP